MARQQGFKLADQHCTTLDCVLQRIADTQELVRKCEACGLDVNASQEELNRQHALASALKAQFFPDRH